ncbi:hypothetical protein POTOM_038156 [Populus tomentosa]|uniref:CCHC-type domain-containing protein n=1 Tax=Populus tomentosa TaxID=118781 RepID=A0A8X7YWX8_POPTO|nr:hypothetical protein POTOM_038156 [Populus tomentosa]
MDPEDLTDTILDGLDDDYKELVRAVQARDTSISFDDLHEKLLSFEAMSSSHATPLPITANLTQKSSPTWRNTRSSFNFRSPSPSSANSHFWRSSPPSTFRPTFNRPNYRPARPPQRPYQGFCQICGIQGHTAKRCPSFQLVPTNVTNTESSASQHSSSSWQPRVNFVANNSSTSPTCTLLRPNSTTAVSWLPPVIKVSVPLPSQLSSYTPVITAPELPPAAATSIPPISAASPIPPSSVTHPASPPPPCHSMTTRSMRSVEESESMTGNSSASPAIDFPTLCHRLKITKRKGWINHGIKGPESIADHMYSKSLMTLIADDRFSSLLVEKDGGTAALRRFIGILASTFLNLLWFAFDFFCPRCNRCIKIAIVHDIAEGLGFGGVRNQNRVLLILVEWEKSPTITTALIGDSIPSIVGDITPSNGVPKQEKIRLEQAALNEMCEVLGGGPTVTQILTLAILTCSSFSFESMVPNASYQLIFLLLQCAVEMILQALESEMEHGKVLDEFFLSTAGKFQTAIGKSWAAEISSRRNSILAKKQN